MISPVIAATNFFPMELENRSLSRFMNNAQQLAKMDDVLSLANTEKIGYLCFVLEPIICRVV